MGPIHRPIHLRCPIPVRSEGPKLALETST